MSHRVERAKQLLHNWAYSKFRPENVVDLDYESGYTGDSPINEFNMVDTKSFRTKSKLTARGTETRSRKESRLPIGGSTKSRSTGSMIKGIDKIFKDSFSKRQLMLLIALFAPSVCLGVEDRKLSDGKIAKLMGFKAARACQIKMKAVDLVVQHLFTPSEDEERMSA